jgi:hypothetical protein
VNHDTSVEEIEKHYSPHIGDHTDAITRRALLDPEAAPENVVPMAQRAKL